MSFFSSKEKQTYTLSIALKSSSIDLQLICSTSKTKKEVLFAERDIIILQNSQDPELYTSQYTKQLTTFFEKNHTKIKQLTQNTPFEVHFILYAPWFTSRISPVVHTKSTTIDEDFLKRKLAHLQGEENLDNLEKRVIKIQANGYTLTNLTKTKYSDIELSLYLSYISKKIHTILTNSIKRYFPTHIHINYTTSPMLILDHIKQYMVREDNVTFLYIDSEISEIGVIEDDSLAYFATFPIGKHDFLREVQANIKTYDYDLLYQKEVQIKSKDQEARFNLLKKKWAFSVNESLGLYKKNIPSKILIITDTKSKNFFTDILLTSSKEDPQSILKNNRIINFDISLLKDIIVYKTPVGEDELDLKLEALI